ncbi:MAG: protein translocase subunit SecD [Proteobacteria bacterium]|nr:protein translocase subunit SecD [Pseudomonadota bacterium]
MLNFSRTKIFVILAVVLFGFMAALPNVLTPQAIDNLPDWMPKDQITLGLDLQGGTYMLLEVDLDAVIQQRYDILVDDVRNTLNENRIRALSPTSDGSSVIVKINREEDFERAFELLEDLSQPITNSILAISQSDIEVEDMGGNTIRVTLTPEGIAQRSENAVDQSLEVVRRRIDELGTKEPTVQKQGNNRILVQVPGANVDPDMLKTTGTLTFHMRDYTVDQSMLERGRVPPRSVIFDYPNDPEGIGQMAVLRRPIVTGDNLTDAQPGFDQQTNVPLVRITFDRQGAVRFADATSKNVGKEFAIVLDNEIISAPVIREAIMGGQAQISGSFTIESAKELSALLRAGSLPAPLTLEDQRSVGPDLGADSVAAGKMAAIIGFVAVMGFIILSYGRFGLAANLALIINMVLIAGVLSLLGATLTLPGIAGIVLTIGMAVDANVLVFERIREEIKLGNPPMAAVSNGYSRAMTTILDANITTLIAAIIMFQYGTGPVRGFAVTLSIGIITSVFSAVILTRLMLSVWLKSRRPKTIKV